MSYKFKGFSWGELAECWGISVEDQPLNIISDDEEFKEMMKTPESIDITKNINGMKVVFTVDEEEEVLAEKIKNHILSNLELGSGDFKDKQIRIDLEDFLNALIEESKKIDYSYPVYEGILKVENDHTFAQWICGNLERLWT